MSRDRRMHMYHKRRQALIKALGGVCQITPAELATFSTRAQKCHGDLQIDHPKGADWERRKVSSHLRVLRYERELAAGVPLRLLCTRHNRSDGWRKTGRNSGWRLPRAGSAAQDEGGEG